MFPFHLHGTKTHTPGFCSSGVERVIRVVFDVETERLVGGGRFGGKKYMLYNVIVLRVNKKVPQTHWAADGAGFDRTGNLSRWYHTLLWGKLLYIIAGISSGINRYDAYIQYSLRFKQHPLKRMLGS